MKSIKAYKLKEIEIKKGNVLKLFKKNDKNFFGINEIYISHIKYNKIKAWKSHKKMKMNVCVIFGDVKFVIYDKNKFKEIVIGSKNKKRLYIAPNTWFGFMGLNKIDNIILNCSNILHTKSEVINKPINYFDYEWK